MSVSNPMIRSAIIKLMLPLACSWVKKQEDTILRDGVALTSQLMADAVRIGVSRPEKVRMKEVEAVPLPLYPTMLQRLAEKSGLLSDSTIGMALGYGINLRSDCRGDRRLAVHELVHVAQYEKLGGIRPFLQQYLREYLTVGYPFGDLEQEALRIEQELCG